MADERSSRKSYNREFEAVHLCTTLNDHVVLGVKKTVRWTVFRGSIINVGVRKIEPTKKI